MVLVARRGSVRERHLTPVAGNGAAEGALADRLAAAQAAAIEPQRRVSELEAALADAVDRSDFAAAAEIQQQLPAAREALGLAEVDVRVITETQAALAAAADAERRKIAEAQQRDQAQRVIEDAQAAEEQTLDAVDAALAEMRDHLRAARNAFQQAQAVEPGVLQARRQAIEARRTLGEWPSHHPGPVPTAPNNCQVLADTDPLVRELARWRP